MKSNIILIIFSLNLLIRIGSAQIPLWGQCANIQGSLGQCASGSYCKFYDAWYSQCIPGTGGDTTTTTTTKSNSNCAQPCPYSFTSLTQQAQFCNDNRFRSMYPCCCSSSSANPTQATSAKPLTTGSSGGLITQSEFNNALTSNGYPLPTTEQYQNLVTQAGPKGGINSKQQLAMFLAEIMWESDGLRAKREYACYPTLGPNCQYNNGGGVPGQNYYGRGYIQLSWDYNYKAASQQLFGSDTLLTNPDQVASNDQTAWATAFWFWKQNVIGGQYGSQVLNGQFGAATNAINGGLECRGAYQATAKKRFEIYKKVLTAFKLTTVPNETGCYN